MGQLVSLCKTNKVRDLELESHHRPAPESCSNHRAGENPAASADRKKRRKKLMPFWKWRRAAKVAPTESSSGQGETVETVGHHESPPENRAEEDYDLQDTAPISDPEPTAEEPPATHLEVPHTLEDQDEVHNTSASRAAGDIVSPETRPLEDNMDMSLDDDIFCRYKPILGNKLGEGAYGDVFEGIRYEDGQKVAVKFATKTDKLVYMTIPGYSKPLPSEVALNILANRGPRVAQIIHLLDWQEEAEYYIMVMECPSPCETMFDFLKRHGGSLNEELARRCMWQATLAAETCCRRGVLHRDIKLENLLVNSDTLEVKLIDFGCGDLLKDSAYKTFNGTDIPPEFTKTGEYYGKPATVWSLGVLLFTLVFGCYPDSNDLHMINVNPWTKPGLSEECCHLMSACLQSEPSQRIDLENILLHDWFKATA